MCGIAAVHDPSGRLDPLPAEMLDALAHRGPDERDHRRVGARSWLGHTRLSIVDLDGGGQPLSGPGGWELVCNGEIYNHAELRAELGAHEFATRSDSEAAVVLLNRLGPAALGRLRGMWALCAATPDGEFLAARDPLGIKPLYWAQAGGARYFASELRALPAAAQETAEAFPPGCCWTPRSGLVRFAEAIPARAESPDWAQLPAAVAEKVTREVLIDSVRSHLMSDVEVGVFLSGGLDSGIVAAIAAAERAESGERLRTFAVGTADSPDLAAARAAARHLGTEHHEMVFDAEQALAAVDEVVASVESFDASLIRSAIPNWFLARLAGAHVKVVLTGEGADELFAGYGHYHRSAGADLDAELRRAVGELHGLNLQRCDRVTMAHGLEARVPFLDAEVIAHAMSLPAEHKQLDEGFEKAHLRRAFAGWLPEELLWRRKLQFGTGSGAQGMLAPVLETRATQADLDAVDAPVRTREELAYYRAFRRALPRVRPEAVLTRFATA